MKRHQLQLTNYPGGKANTDLRVSSSKTLQAQQQAPLQGSTGQLPGSHWCAARFLCSALAVQGASVVFSYRKHGHRVNILVPNLSKQGRMRCWVAHCKCFSGNTTCTQLQPADLIPSLCTAGRQHINRASKQVSSLKTKPAPSYSQPGARKGTESKAWSKQQVQNASVGLLPATKGCLLCWGLAKKPELTDKQQFQTTLILFATLNRVLMVWRRLFFQCIHQDKLSWLWATGHETRVFPRRWLIYRCTSRQGLLHG